jgi:hypothetical protein
VNCIDAMGPRAGDLVISNHSTSYCAVDLVQFGDPPVGAPARFSMTMLTG